MTSSWRFWQHIECVTVTAPAGSKVASIIGTEPVMALICSHDQAEAQGLQVRAINSDETLRVPVEFCEPTSPCPIIVEGGHTSHCGHCDGSCWVSQSMLDDFFELEREAELERGDTVQA